MSLVGYADEELYALLKKGEERALQVILNRYWEPLYQMAFSISDDPFACEDIVQDIFIKIWKNRDTLVFSCSLRAYLFASTRYEIYHQVKAKIRKDERIVNSNFDRVEHYNPHSKLEAKQLMENVSSLVEALPKRCREVYLLSREEQLSNKEIALRMQVSTKTVENQITIALRRIRLGLDEESLTLQA